ncbi:hypothetical protein BXZ70DRAFT_1076798, partial [Cristinia sonorae]
MPARRTRFNLGTSLEHIAAPHTGESFNWGGVDDPNAFTEYCSLRANCCFSYKDNTTLNDRISVFSGELNARNRQQVLAGAAAGIAADCLEAGLRLWTGCTVKKDVNRAMEWWLRISTDTQLNGLPVPKNIMVRAIACLANSQWELRITPEDGPDVWNIDSVYRAGGFADTCCSLGFVPPCVLFIGTRILDLQAQPNAALQGFRHPRFSALTFLREAVKRRGLEVEKESKRRDEKIEKAPNAYICAAPGCGIEGTRKSALLRCSGKCPMDIKPSYCSKECQRAHWKTHKPACKPSAAVDSATTEPIGSQTTGASVPPEPEPGTSRLSDEDMQLRTDGREVRMKVPNILSNEGKATISSKTLPPEFMKEIRDMIEHEVSVRR